MRVKRIIKAGIGIILLSICLLAGDQTCLAAGSLDLKDGTYQIEVTMTGGSGRATITTPTKLVVKDGKATAEIKWSSPNYDYMKMDGVTYQPDTTDPVSVFTLPVSNLDQEITVIGDTTAMSVPHEVEYTLYFQKDSIKQEGSSQIAIIIVVLVIGVAAIGMLIMRRRKKKKNGSI